VASKPSPKARLLSEYLQRAQPPRVGEDEWREIAGLLAPISDRTLRKLLRESGWPLDPVIEGVRQETPEELERTLLALLEEYLHAVDPERKQACRRAVITAKDHARFRSEEKAEAILWMLTWLENPAVFPAWARLRKNALGSAMR
jgi:hypothetical protein